MNVYLAQHAQAVSEQEDTERPLSESGRSDIKKVAAYIAAAGNVNVQDIFHSGKTRAEQTAEVLAEQVSPSKVCKAADGLKPLDDPSVWAERLAQRTEDVMLVGHLPHLSKLVSLLLYRDVEKEVVEFQMGGIVCLGRDGSRNWLIRWMLIPDVVQ